MEATPSALRSVVNVSLCAVALAVASPAAANLLVNGDFDSTTTGTFFPSADFSANSPAVGWIDQSTWATVSGDGTNHAVAAPPAAPASSSGGNWARQWSGVDGNTGTMLMQGFAASGLGAGTTLNVSFEYITHDAAVAQIYLYGLDAGESWSQFPPNSCTGCDLLSATVPGLGTSTGAWTLYSTNITLTRSFAAIAFGVYFATNNPDSTDSYIAGIDDVSITASSVVPLPAAAWLLLSGLGALGALARRRRT